MDSDPPKTRQRAHNVDVVTDERAGRELLVAEVERLKAEIKEKEVLLEAREMEVKMIKQSMEKRIRELERIVKRQAREREKKSRLVSFVGTVEKRH